MPKQKFKQHASVKLKKSTDDKSHFKQMHVVGLEIQSKQRGEERGMEGKRDRAWKMKKKKQTQQWEMLGRGQDGISWLQVVLGQHILANVGRDIQQRVADAENNAVAHFNLE